LPIILKTLRIYPIITNDIIKSNNIQIGKEPVNANVPRFPKNIQASLGKAPQIPNRIRFIKHIIFLAILVGGALVLVAAFGRGEGFFDRLLDSYQTVLDHTTEGTAWTDIMIENQLYYIVPAGLIMVGLGWMLSLNYAERAVFMYSVFGIGFVGGHVFW
jgi:hypothetical protein